MVNEKQIINSDKKEKGISATEPLVTQCVKRKTISMSHSVCTSVNAYEPQTLVNQKCSATINKATTCIKRE